MAFPKKEGPGPNEGLAPHIKAQAEQIAEREDLLVKVLAKSFRYSKGNPIAQAEYLLRLKGEKGIDLLGFSGEALMANSHIRDELVAALRRQHPTFMKVESWGSLVFVLTQEIEGVLSTARKLAAEASQ